VHVVREVFDGLRIVEVAPRRHVVHAEVLLHEVLDLDDVVRLNPEALKDDPGELRAALRMRFASDVLADVMEQRGHEDHVRPGHFDGEPRGERVFASELTTSQRAHPIDSRDRVHVDGVDVIDVVVHAPDHRRKLRNHREQEADLVELGEQGVLLELDAARRAHEAPEQARRLFALPKPLTEVLVLGDAGDGVPRSGGHAHVAVHRLPIEPERKGRIGVELVRIFEADRVSHRDEPVAEADLSATSFRRNRAAEQRIVEVRDHARMAIILAHHALTGGASRPVAHALRHELLLFEAEAVRTTARVIMEHVAHAHQKRARVLELLVFPRQEHADIDQRLEALYAPARERGPLDHVEIARPPLAIFDVRLEQVNGVTEPEPALVRLVLEHGEEVSDLRGSEDGAEGLGLKFVTGLRVADDVPPVEQRRGRGHVRASQVDGLAGGDDLMTDLEPRVPERVEQRLRDRSGFFRRLTEQAHIEIGAKPEAAATVTADRRERETSEELLVAVFGANGAEQRAQQPIEHSRPLFARGIPRFAPPCFDQSAHGFGVALEVDLDLAREGRRRWLNIQRSSGGLGGDFDHRSFRSGSAAHFRF
jgi:hypothetical protein